MKVASAGKFTTGDMGVAVRRCWSMDGNNASVSLTAACVDDWPEAEAVGGLSSTCLVLVLSTLSLAQLKSIRSWSVGDGPLLLQLPSAGHEAQHAAGFNAMCQRILPNLIKGDSVETKKR